MGSYIYADYFNYIFEIARYGIIFGFVIATVLKLLSYGIFKAFSLVDIARKS